jgi:Cu(I)/Ag(I) efflux system membrane fusion protein
MYANVISKDKAKTYLTLPQSAVIRKDNKYYAFMVGEYEGEYEPIEVHVKPLDNKTYIVLDGLGEGDEVVNNALFMMDSDAQINGLY